MECTKQQYPQCPTILHSRDKPHVKVQREALAESSVVLGRVFGNKMGRRLTVVEEGLFSGIATSTVQVSTQDDSVATPDAGVVRQPEAIALGI